MKAIAYCRCSDPRQDKSVEEQRAEIEKRALANGHRVIAWFEDEGLSGRKNDRPEYRRLIHYASSGKAAAAGVGVVYLWKLNRLGRNQLATLQALKKIEDDGGLKVVSLMEAEPEDKKIRKLYRGVVTLMDELYSDSMAEDVERGMEAQARRGFWLYGRPPFGYALHKRKEDSASRLVVNNDTRKSAAVVQRIAQLYIGGMGMQGIAELLTAEGVEPPARRKIAKRRQGLWRSKHVRSILTNPAYRGAITFNKEVVCEGAHEAIIDETTWETIQRLREARNRNKPHAGRLNRPTGGFFRPLLKCGLCGGTMWVVGGGSGTRRDYQYYACGNRAQNKNLCRGLTVRVDELDPLLTTSIEEDILTEGSLRSLVEQTIDLASITADGEASAARDELVYALEMTNQEVRNVVHQVRRGIIRGEDAERELAPLYCRRDDLEAKLEALPEPQPVPSMEEVDIGAFRQALVEAWHSKDEGARRRALDSMIEEITLHPGEAAIKYAWKAGSDTFQGHTPYGPP
jgi:site-specific DNA recombinase